MINPNILKRTAPFAVAAAIGLSACSSAEQPDTPPTTNPQVRVLPPPECTGISYRQPDQKKLTINFGLKVINDYEPGMYNVGHTEFDFGDGKKDDENGLSEDHTYAKPGTYVVKAAVIMDVAEGARTPFRDGMPLSCPPVTITLAPPPTPRR